MSAIPRAIDTPYSPDYTMPLGGTSDKRRDRTSALPDLGAGRHLEEPHPDCVHRDLSETCYVMLPRLKTMGHSHRNFEKPASVTKPLRTSIGLEQPTDAGNASHDMFSIFAVMAFAVVFVGFARTFFLRFVFSSRSMPLYLYLHGLLFSGWFVIFFIQTRLIAWHRVDLHRRLGVIVPLAVGVAIHAGKRVYTSQTKPFSMEAPPLALDLGACLAFTVFIGLAFYLRRRSEVHKRLMLLGSCSILLPAIARIPSLFGFGGLWGLVGFTETVPLTFILYDTIRFRRLHPAFAWGGLAIVLSWPTFLIFGSTEHWLRFTEWLVRR
jgi:hypothetical protein